MTADILRSLVVTALKGKTDAGNRIYSPLDWPTFTGDYPDILVQTPIDVMDSIGRAAPQFTTTTTIRISGRVEEFDNEGDTTTTGAMRAESALETLKKQILKAVINSYDLTRQIQQFKQIRSAIDVSSDGESHVGQLVFEMDLEYYQGPEDFYPPDTSDLTEIDISIQEPEGTTSPVLTIKF